MNALTETRTGGMASLAPQNFEQALTFANYLAESTMVPKEFQGKPGNCLVAMQWGAEVGLQPLQALQNIAVINGRPSLWGDSLIALVRSSPLCEYVIEEDDGKTATCRVKRRGEPEQTRTFSMDDAKAAGLQGKQGPWTQYPKRMRQMRARAFAMRDIFPDVLRGMPVAEEVMDSPKDMGTAEIVVNDAVSGLISAAEAAAANGVGAYHAFWKSITHEERSLIQDEHPRLKAQASDVDKARTVEPAPAKPPVTFDDVLEKINTAKNEDELYIAGDLINYIAGLESQRTLNDKFDERLAQMRGVA